MPRQSADRCFWHFPAEFPWYNTALIYKQCCCCNSHPAPSHPPLPVKTCCCLLPLQLLQFFIRLVTHQAPHAKSFLRHYPFFLPSSFTVLISCCLSAQFCSTTSAVPVLPNLCSCLLWPVACLETSEKNHQAIRIEKTLENPVSYWNITEKLRDDLTVVHEYFHSKKMWCSSLRIRA